ncbi:unnamed protein product [Effrenium voratum]|uniref:Uncharacterized protein n=1 Tax=Effrenium voratum TaxID=2562239 RepID=A0AA36MVG5_9DINO|nr:unnamed protein product [Effrenium voratum]
MTHGRSGRSASPQLGPFTKMMFIAPLSRKTRLTLTCSEQGYCRLFILCPARFCKCVNLADTSYLACENGFGVQRIGYVERLLNRAKFGCRLRQEGQQLHVTLVRR